MSDNFPTNDELVNLLIDIKEFIDSCGERHNSRDYYQFFDEQLHYDVDKKICLFLEKYA